MLKARLRDTGMESFLDKQSGSIPRNILQDPTQLLFTQCIELVGLLIEMKRLEDRLLLPAFFDHRSKYGTNAMLVSLIERKRPCLIALAVLFELCPERVPVR